jgi:phosphohistidine phosphatase SixA
VLVSHQPLVSYLIDHLLGEVALVPALPPGGLVTMDLAAPARACGRLLFWALPPQYEADR